jgi:cytochrome c oxidase assembly factor CtaG
MTGCSVLGLLYTKIFFTRLTGLNTSMFKMRLAILLFAYIALAKACYMSYNNIAFLNQTYLSGFPRGSQLQSYNWLVFRRSR